MEVILWIGCKKMNSAISYIKSHLDKEIDLNWVGKIAGCNAYQFQRVFSYVANTTLAEYIRRRMETPTGNMPFFH